MQTTIGTIRREPGRTVAQGILIIAVALAGVAFGRWIIPADDGSVGASSVTGTTQTSAAAVIAQHKFDSGTLEDVLFGEAIVPPNSALHSDVPARTISEHKFNSGTLEDVLFGDTTVLGAAMQPETNPLTASIAQRKYDSGRLEEILFGTN